MPTNRPGGHRVAAAAAVVLLASVVVGVSSAPAASPSVTGTVTGRPKPASRAVTEVRALDLAGASVAGTARVRANGAFRLDLPPGAYVLDTSITPLRGGRVTTGAPVAVSIASGQRRRGVRVSASSARSATASRPTAQAAYTQESHQITPGSIAVRMDNFTGATGDFAVLNRGLPAILTGDLAASACRTKTLASSADLVFVLQELKLQKSKYFDPATRIVRNFIVPDILVRGRLHTSGDSLSYTLTLIDARTGAALEALSGSLLRNDGFGPIDALGKQLAKRICSYGEVYEATFTGTSAGSFAAHTASGTLAAQAIIAKPTANDGRGATLWQGSAPMGWTGVTAISNVDCSFANPLSGGTWTAKLALVGTTMRVLWIADGPSSGTITENCPDADGTVTTIPGEPTTSLVSSGPDPFILPASSTQTITSAFDSSGYGWNNTLQMTIRTIKVQPLG
jgi:hypothetical protein